MSDVLHKLPERSKVKSHKDLEVWKRAIALVNRVYDCTLLFPKEELYGLVSQMRRAAVSIPSNIAEGCARNSRKELVQFIHVARGSLAELETQVIIAWHRKYLAYEAYHELTDDIDHISRLLTRWKQSLSVIQPVLKEKEHHASRVTHHQGEFQ